MRLLALSLTILLALQACAPLSPPAAPSTEPAERPTTEPPAAETGAPPTYQESALAVVWQSRGASYVLELLDPATGELAAGYEPIVLGRNYYHAFSADGSTLAFVTYKTDSSPTRPSLHLIDIASWTDRVSPLDVTGWASKPAFSPDGKFLAVAFNHRQGTLTLIDLQSGALAATAPTEMDISRLKFTGDGSGLMAYGHVIVDRFTASERSAGPGRVILFDAADLSTRWSADLDGVRDGVYAADEIADPTALFEDLASAVYLYPGLVFAPARDLLYILHADEDKLTTVDFAARSTETVSIRPKLTWLERILMLGAGTAHAKVANGTSRSAVISPDGATIYTVALRNEAEISSSGDWEFTQTPLGFRAIDAASGATLAELDSNATEVSISPDGGTVYLQSWGHLGLPTTELFDVETGEFTIRMQNAFVRPIYRMDRTLILVSSTVHEDNRSYISAYTPEGELLGEWTAAVYADWLTP